MSQEVYRNKPKILIVCSFYLPGYKAGGGLRTVVNTVERFEEKFDFMVITQDQDADGVPYSSIKSDVWNLVGSAKVFYLSRNNFKPAKLRELILHINPDLIYLNSVFSILSIYVLMLRKVKLLPKIPIILAPEGELSKGALELKPLKKDAFSKLAKKVGLYENLIWKVTAEPEKIETERFMGKGGKMFVAPNLPPVINDNQVTQKPKLPKAKGEAKMVFLSRLARKKNFKWLVKVLQAVKGNLILDVYGPLEDETYWREITSEINNLPANIQVEYKGQVSHEEVPSILAGYHFFVLPTLGENFGHVFIEALTASCPLLISDRTPWIDLERQAIGWDLPLENQPQWIQKIEECIEMDEVIYGELSMNAAKYAEVWLKNPKIEEATLNVIYYGLK